MCGIVGYIGERPAVPLLLDGLRRLEYRGYDSAGLGLQYQGSIQVVRSSGRISLLEAKLERLNGTVSKASIGIGHTRWATHGRPSEDNAHPHASRDGKVVVVHNGIFENFLEIRAELKKRGVFPRSETDTECFPLLVSLLMQDGLGFEQAFRAAVSRMRGIYAILCMHADHPDQILVTRSGPPLVLGLATGECFIASDVAPLLSHTHDVLFLEDGDIAKITLDGILVEDRQSRRVERKPQHIEWDAESAELAGHAHYMQKEIFEQPQALTNTWQGQLDGERIALDLPFSEQELKKFERATILACGTSWHAGLVGKFLLEQLADIEVQVDYASEYRYRDPIVRDGTLAIAITQSGETADTLAALREAASRGARTLAICNVRGSQATRLAEGTILTNAGPEIGVASTKAFTTQLAALTLLAARLGELRGVLEPKARAELVAGLRALPAQLESVRALEPGLVELAKEWKDARNALFLGRGPLYPLALEGALKMKEISYVHAEGYPAGEMKHGPIALIDSELPIVALMPSDRHRDRTLSNLQEAAARGGKIAAFVSAGDRSLDSIAHRVFELPRTHACLSPILYAVPLQLLAYHFAVLRGCDVDRPRNLAKSVTVE
jgi:glucosamine--fructose-6-phosphate aminotransferase (isomerizing)